MLTQYWPLIQPFSLVLTRASMKFWTSPTVSTALPAPVMRVSRAPLPEDVRDEATEPSAKP